MKKIYVNLDAKSHYAYIGAGVFTKLPAVIKHLRFKGPLVVVTDKVLWARYKKVMISLLRKTDLEYHCLVVPASERSKSPETYEGLVKEIIDKTKMHQPLVIAFGGGVVGDLAGFVAATYRRGIPYLQVPTTLLAQVDSSIGGKVGIDLPEAKNIIGAFHQPKAVLVDTDFLATLPLRQLRNGFAEVLKYAVIWDRELFSFLESNIRKVFLLERVALERVVTDCVYIKSRIVEQDERDSKDIRIFLNFGHTLGHAIEASSGYGDRYYHGESVALGMLMACDIASELGMLDSREYLRIKELIRRAGLPLSIRGVSFDEIVKTYLNDKKFTRGTNRFVLPAAIGKAEIIEDIPEILIKNVIKRYVA